MRPAQEGVRAHRRVDRAEVVAQDAVVVERGDRVERGEDLLAQRVLLAGHDRPVRVEPHLEVAARAAPTTSGCRAKVAFWYSIGSCAPTRWRYLRYARSTATWCQVRPGGDDQPVERVGLRLAAPDGRDAVGHALAAVGEVEQPAVLVEHAEVVQEGLAVAAVEARRHLLVDLQAEVLEDRQHLGQLHLAAGLVDADARQVLRAAALVLQRDAERLAGRRGFSNCSTSTSAIEMSVEFL